MRDLRFLIYIFLSLCFYVMNVMVCVISGTDPATVAGVCMIFCNLFEGMHDFSPRTGVKIMHTLDFVAELF